MALQTFNPDNVTMQDFKTGTIPQEISDTIIMDILNGSAFMQLAKEEPMNKPEKVFTKMSGVGAYWVDEGEIIKTSAPMVLKFTMRSKKLGVIIVTTKENLQYSMSDFFEIMKPQMAEAFYQKIDGAAFAGTDNPFAYSIKKSTDASGNIVIETGNKYDDINEAMKFVEKSGKKPNGVAATLEQAYKYRATKDSTGRPILNEPSNGEPDKILNLPIAWLPNDTFGNEIKEIVGDWNEAYYGILQGIQYEITTEGTISSILDQDGKPLNLFERDMAAIKATMEVAIMITKDESFSIIKAPVTP